MCTRNLNFKDRHYLRVKVLEKLFQSNGYKKQTGVTLLKSSKIAFKVELIKRYREAHFIILKEKKIHQDKVSIMNIYTPNPRGSTFINPLPDILEPIIFLISKVIVSLR